MFITLEGIEGSGKTTQIGYAAEYLRNKGHDCVITREPGGTCIGEKIRAILLDSDSKRIDPRAELLLYIADRIQHINEIVRPALAAGRIVLCDRYFDATIAYQGFGRGLNRDMIFFLHKEMAENLKPNITILLDLPSKVGLSRAWNQIHTGGRTVNETRFEEEKISFHEKVRSGYLDLARMEPERFRIIDASESPEKVRKEVLKALAI